MITVAIDPGQTGAFSVKNSNGLIVAVEDMPVSPRLHGSGDSVSASGVAEILLRHKATNVVLEQVAAMPGQGVSSMFRFGEGFGILQGVLGALGIPFVFVRPNVWKKKAGLTGKDKDAARTLAIQLCPHLSGELARKKDIGRADAVLLNLYGV